MPLPHRNKPEPAEPMFRYVMWFVAAFFITALLAGLVQVALPKWTLVRIIGGIAIVFASAEFARRRFLADYVRPLRSNESWRLFWGSELFLLAFLSIVLVIAIRFGNASPFAFRKIPESLGLLVAILSCLMYSPVFWISYWLLNGRAVADAPKTVQLQQRIKVLVIGSGGREHALAWKLAQSRRVGEVLVAPGNAGTAREMKCRNIDIAATDIDNLLLLAKRENVAMTVVGPEGPLVAGIVDRFRAAGQRIFGPSAAAARLEGSKAFAKDFLKRHGIPTAHYQVFTDVDPALAYLREKGVPIVVKADGLAAGKGVVVAMTLDVAQAAVRDMLDGNAFGSAGSRVVIEEFLDGEEASFISMVDGDTALPMATSQDHKRVGDGDTGPNTGGMGAYSPAPVVTPEVHARVLREIVEPTIKGMRIDGCPFTGFLYAGLMIDRTGAPKVIEFNVRFGDPETQPVMMRLQSDLADLLDAAIDRHLDEAEIRWNPRPALGVVMAAANYPGAAKTGDRILGLDTPQPIGSKVFHAGTKAANGDVLTAGGRVLCACALGDNVAEAQRHAYEAAAQISWDGEFHRHDIGWRAITRERG